MAYKCPFTHELFTNKSRLERHVSNRTTFMKVVQYNANTNQYWMPTQISIEYHLNNILYNINQ